MISAILLFAMQSAPAPAVPPPPAPSACDTAAHAAFDFWVGDWDVFASGTDRLVAHSRIERLYAGCAVRENWMPLKGSGGGSLNNLDPATGRWHQTWIGSSPGRVEFEGGPVAGGMVLTGYWQDYSGPGQHALVRMTYSVVAADTVRQHGEASTDYGATWQDSFDFAYQRAAAR